MSPVGPRELTPARFGRPWGGGRFGTVGDEPVGELWISGDEATLPDGRTLIKAGLAASVPLVKVLDVAAQLSVQVHPDDRIAGKLHGPVAIGKHEAWVVLEATPDAALALGLVDPNRLDDLFSGDRERVTAALALRAASKGMVVDVPPGTVHAPAAGVLLYEVQQRSDLTYRIFDWGRSRPLHIAEARRALSTTAPVAISQLPEGPGRIPLIHSPAPFALELCRPGEGSLELRIERRAVLSVTRDDILIDGLPLHEGGHWLLEPGKWTLAGSGEGLLALWR